MISNYSVQHIFSQRLKDIWGIYFISHTKIHGSAVVIREQISRDNLKESNNIIFGLLEKASLKSVYF